MLKIINHESRLARATSTLKTLAYLLIGSLMFVSFAQGNDGKFGFDEDDAATTGATILWWWDTWVKWAVVIVCLVFIGGNLFFDGLPLFKIHWFVYVLLLVVVGLKGDVLFSKIASVDLEALRSSLN